MRIRSIKPEFWTSEDVAALDWDTRLLFIGLWSYVDDNGVGRDVEKLICAELFPLEDDPRETLARVSRGLRKLSEALLITRYEVGGKNYLHITTWAKHQRVDKPNRERYPAPTRDDARIRETVEEPSRDPRETLAPGTEEQGNRGEKKAPSSAAADALFEEFWSLYPKKVEKQAARRKWDTTIKRTDPADIIAGLRRYVDYWQRKGTEKQFIKGPEVWLNKGCWTDELDDSLAAAGGWFPGA